MTSPPRGPPPHPPPPWAEPPSTGYAPPAPPSPPGYGLPPGYPSPTDEGAVRAFLRSLPKEMRPLVEGEVERMRLAEIESIAVMVNSMSAREIDILIAAVVSERYLLLQNALERRLKRGTKG